MYSARRTAVLPAVGFPIRASTDHRLFSAYSWLFAAVHALLRLLVPRHPPCALDILTVIFLDLPAVDKTAGIAPRGLRIRVVPVFVELLCSFQGPPRTNGAGWGLQPARGLSKLNSMQAPLSTSRGATSARRARGPAGRSG